ncbi:Proteasome activator complex subunit 3 [Balamuthia mandrillaris]
MEDKNNSGDELQRRVEGLRKDVAESAEEIIKKAIPAKIMELSTLLESALFTHKLEDVPQEVYAGGADSHGTKKRKHAADNKNSEPKSKGNDTRVPANEIVSSLVAIVKKQALDVIDALNTVKVWIQLRSKMATILELTTYASVCLADIKSEFRKWNAHYLCHQEESIQELTRVEDAGYALIESITKYYVTRGKLVSKVLKYPGIMDYRRSVDELDEKEYINLKLSTLDLRNNLAIAYDMLTKNMDKIVKPRTSHHMEMF